MGWDGMGWDGMGWDGMGWDGMGWDGTGLDGMVRDGTGRDETRRDETRRDETETRTRRDTGREEGKQMKHRETRIGAHNSTVLDRVDDAGTGVYHMSTCHDTRRVTEPVNWERQDTAGKTVESFSLWQSR